MSIVENIQSAKTEEDAERAVAELRLFHTPRLDAFRQEITTRKTSDLFHWLGAVWGGSGETLIAKLGYDVEADDETETQVASAAAIIAISDEIDRRIPIPGL